MDIAEISIRNRVIVIVLTVLSFVAGTLAFFDLGRLEDPDFTIKTALVVTQYPGASPGEVETEVTEKVERAIQQMAQLKRIRSLSKAGVSIIWADIKDHYIAADLPQVWDELRRKVNDVQPYLPPGAGTSMVRDDFGDVYGIFFGITGDGYSYKEIKDYADVLKRELLLVPGVAKVTMWGERTEAVYVEISRARMAELGIPMEAVFQTLNARNLVAEAGKVRVGDEYIRIDPTGLFDSVDDIGELLLTGGGADGMVRLKDIAEVKRGYVEPATRIMRYNGKPAIGMGISNVPGGNVVEMGKAVRKKIEAMQAQTPLGMELHFASFQGETVEKAVNGFLINLAEALAIVIAVLLLTMGLRSGLIIGLVLLQTVAITFVFMSVYDITLQRISLGALILALGMLVDNAIVVTEGILVKIQQGMDRVSAAGQTVANTMWPLFGATVVAVLAFASIGTSHDSTGEFCGSLFQVILISLMASWVLAVTVTPLICHDWLKVNGKAQGNDPYGHPVFRLYRRLLDGCLHWRKVTCLVMLGILGVSLWGFGFVQHSFFPDSTRKQFYVEYWRPQGTHIDAVSDDLKKIRAEIAAMEGVTETSTYVGAGSLRFMLTYDPQMDNESYGMVLVSVDELERIDGLMSKVERYLAQNWPDANPKVRRFAIGPAKPAKIEARFSGPDPVVLRELAEQAKNIMRADPASKYVRDNWRQRVKVARPQFREIQARGAGVVRPELAQALRSNFSGTSVGVYREGDDLLPIIARAPENERTDIGEIKDVQVWSSTLNKAVPFGQIASGVKTEFEDPQVWRRDRKRTITAQCDPAHGTAAALHARIRPAVEGINLPVGYQMEWGGEFESSRDAQSALFATVPHFFTAMVVIVIMLFNALRQPTIIFLTLPLAVIGLTAGLLATGQPMGFMAILGALSLTGMLIKNAIVLIDQIDMEIRDGKTPYAAVLDSSVSRVRPVCMAAVTTILGMIPLVFDRFFAAMAVAIMSGLAFATILTLIVVPVLYVMFFHIHPLKKQES